MVRRLVEGFNSVVKRLLGFFASVFDWIVGVSFVLIGLVGVLLNMADITGKLLSLIYCIAIAVGVWLILEGSGRK